MPNTTVLSYNELVSSLKMMADGVHIHKEDQDFPTLLNEEIIRTLKTEFEHLRETYDQANSKALQAQKQYREAEKHAIDEMARYRDSVYGRYTKKSPVVNDFGLKPYKPKGPSSKGTDANPAPE